VRNPATPAASADPPLAPGRAWEILPRDPHSARAAGWLETVEQVTHLARQREPEAIVQSWPGLLVARVKFQAAAMGELTPQGFRPEAMAGAALVLDPSAAAEAAARLAEQPSGMHDGGDHPLARHLGLARFLWCAVELPAMTWLAVAGFDDRAAPFQQELEEQDLAYFRMVCRQLEASVGHVLSIHDLTAMNGMLERRGEELQQALSELREAQEQLVQRERLAAVGQVAGGVAHEINNPACYVQTNLRALRDALAGQGPLDVAEMREMVEESLQGMARIVSLVRDLGGFARHDRKEALDQAVDVDDVVRQAERLLGDQVRRGAVVHFHLGAPPPVAGSRSQLTQLFVSLLMNALQGMPAGRPREWNRVDVSTALQGDRVVAVVRDNGAPLTAEERQRIFEPLGAPRPAAAGAALGLGSAREIARRHGGAVRAESGPDGGNAFAVDLPLAGAARREAPLRAER